MRTPSSARLFGIATVTLVLAVGVQPVAARVTRTSPRSIDAESAAPRRPRPPRSTTTSPGSPTTTSPRRPHPTATTSTVATSTVATSTVAVTTTVGAPGTDPDPSVAPAPGTRPTTASTAPPATAPVTTAPIPETTAAPTSTATTGTTGTPQPTTIPSNTIGATRLASQPDTMPLAATSGTPRVRQLRNGAVVAEYTNLGAGGPFTRTHAWNVTQPGDVFEVYPAVYEGPGQYPWIGPLPNNAADYNAGIFQRPTNITIRGVTVNGRRPVVKLGTTADYNILGHGMIEINGVDGLVFENIDIDGTGGTVVDRAGFYVTDSSNVTLRNSRVHGFQTSQHNGVFDAGANSGYLHLDNVRLYENGGWDGPAHNVYVNAGDIDPNFTLTLTNSWSSAVNVGHLFKSRAQVTMLDGNLLEGTDAPAGWDCAESFGLDVPNGGRIAVTNNVFVKAKPGGVPTASPCATAPREWTWRGRTAW